jgi:hypothetical protein
MQVPIGIPVIKNKKNKSDITNATVVVPLFSVPLQIDRVFVRFYVTALTNADGR